MTSPISSEAFRDFKENVWKTEIEKKERKKVMDG